MGQGIKKKRFMACFLYLHPREEVKQPGNNRYEEVEPFTQIRQVVAFTLVR